MNFKKTISLTSDDKTLFNLIYILEGLIYLLYRLINVDN
jgi:hypothetical protein